MSGSCSSIRARTRRCFCPPESTSRHGLSLVQLVVELADEAAEARPRQHLRDRQRVEVPGAARVGHELLERQALGQVGLLRGQEHPRARGHRHAGPRRTARGPRPP